MATNDPNKRGYTAGRFAMDLGGTFAGNPLAIAAAHAVLDIIDEEKLCERATVLERLRAA